MTETNQHERPSGRQGPGAPVAAGRGPDRGPERQPVSGLLDGPSQARRRRPGAGGVGRGAQPLLVAHLWLLSILFGAILFESVVVFPDIFQDVPASFETALAFMDVRAPDDFFPPLGMLCLVSGVAAVVATWRYRTVRPWVVAAVAVVFLGEFVFSALYFWPRNTTMFVEGPAVHPPDVLRRVAGEFQLAHWLRVAWGGASTALAFTGFVRLHRQAVLGEREAEVRRARGGRARVT